MKRTERQSTKLKRMFKEHFAAYGLDAPLPPELQAEADAYPLEYGEASEEYERFGSDA